MVAKLNLRRLFTRPIVIQQCFIDLVGDVNAALMLSQSFYWLEIVEEERDGWFYKCQADWEKETRLTRPQQERARTILRKFDFWEEKYEGLPRRLWFRINEEKLEMALIGLGGDKPAGQHAENQHTSPRETSDQARGKASGINKNTKITPKTSTKRDNGKVGKGDVENFDPSPLSEREEEYLRGK